MDEQVQRQIEQLNKMVKCKRDLYNLLKNGGTCVNNITKNLLQNREQLATKVQENQDTIHARYP